MSRYLVIYERGSDSWGAYSPDLPGCVAVGDSRTDVELLMNEAVALHLDTMRESGAVAPVPSSFAGYVAA